MEKIKIQDNHNIQRTRNCVKINDYRRLKKIMHEKKPGLYVLRFEYEIFTIFLFRR